MPEEMAARLPQRTSLSPAVVLLAVAVPPAIALIGLGLQLLREDRALLAQRDLERRQGVVAAVVRSLEWSIADTERHVLDGPVPGGMVRLAVTADRVSAQPADRVQWLPGARTMPAVESTRFADAERLEFQGSTPRALALYRKDSTATSSVVRAGALLRIARVLRARKEWDAALDTYRRLATITDVAIAQSPADLQARRAICAILADVGREAALRREAARLESDLVRGRWTLDRPAWELTTQEIQRWTGRSLALPAEGEMFSHVADALAAEAIQTVAPRQTITVGEASVVLLARQRDNALIALAVSPAAQRMWIEKALSAAGAVDTQLQLIQPNAPAPFANNAASAHETITASASDTGLPWTIAMRFGGPSPIAADLANRQRLMAVGLAAILLFFAGGSYFLWRVMQRELAVARLQTDFVSAVSHEFRTPLTSLRHVTELLQEDDGLPPSRRREFYDALVRNTQRLHHLVESLLDFARMESGRKPYDLKPVNAEELVTNVVDEFRQEVSGRGFAVELLAEPGFHTSVRGDRASLANAIWNLLDNAVKYSSDSRAVQVCVRPSPVGIEIAVTDRGLGIPAHERGEIFLRFVRGATARRLGIRGTGLGLALVSHIVAAHGGRIEVDTQEGVGSTFRILLPVLT